MEEESRLGWWLNTGLIVLGAAGTALTILAFAGEFIRAILTCE